MARAVAGIVLAAALAVSTVGCGNAGCPTTAAAVDPNNQTPTCSGSGQNVSVEVHLCEECSHTNPSCDAQISGSDIFLDTKWEVCTDNAGCTTSGCTTATCTFNVQPGTYTLTEYAIDSTPTFTLTVGTGTPTCVRG